MSNITYCTETQYFAKIQQFLPNEIVDKYILPYDSYWMGIFSKKVVPSISMESSWKCKRAMLCMDFRYAINYRYQNRNFNDFDIEDDDDDDVIIQNSKLEYPCPTCWLYGTEACTMSYMYRYTWWQRLQNPSDANSFNIMKENSTEWGGY